MKYYYQLNNLDKKISTFYNSNREQIPEKYLPKTIQKVALGFPYAVLFDPPMKGKIYAYVLDNAGRKQYFYTKEYKEKMEEKKYKKFPKILEKVEKLLKDCKNDDSEVALAIMLMDECNFRIGHEKYKKLYGTNGTLTLNSNHMNKTKNGIEIEFNGKKKEVNYCLVKKSSDLYDRLDKIADKSKTPLFKDIKYDDVYEFLKKYDVRPKDIRQVSANRNFYDYLRKIPYDNECKFKKFLKKILEKTSSKMNHTSSVCKKEYLMPQWFVCDEKLKNYVKNHDFNQTIKYISHIE